MNLFQFLEAALFLAGIINGTPIPIPESCTITGHQYRLSTQRLNWAEAQNACVKWGGILATQDHVLEKQQLATFFDNSNTLDYWINGHPEHCLTTRLSNDPSNKQLISEKEDCNLLHPFICQTQAFKSAQDEELIFRVSGDLTSSTLSHASAERACQQWGGQLASLFGEKERDLVSGLLDKTGGYWINPVPDLEIPGDGWQKKCHLFEYRQKDEDGGRGMVNWIDEISMCDVKYKYICEKGAQQKSSVPDKITSTSVVNTACDMLITWTPPFSCNFPLTSYTVQVTDSLKNNQFVTLPECGTDGKTNNCSVPMEMVNGWEEGENGQSYVAVRVKACNENGCSFSWSNTTIMTYKVHGPPLAPSMTEEVKIDGRLVAIGWSNENHLHAPVHEVFWDGGKAGKFEKLGETGETNFEIMTEPPYCSFQFKVRAKVASNEGYCTGVFSEALTAGVQTAPVQLSTVQVEINRQQCGVHIRWDPPHDGCIDISKYRFLLHDKPIDECFSHRKSDCDISIQKLREKYALKNTEDIQIKGKACNDFGCAERWSDVVKLNMGELASPDKMKAPWISKLTKENSVIIEWEKVPSATYKLQWFQNGAFQDIELANSTDQQHLIENLVRGREYKFRVRADNTCGKGTSYSDVLFEKFPEKPNLSVSAKGKDVIFSWEEPADNGGSTIDLYQVRLGKSTDSSKNLACEVSADQRSCTIEMKKLLQPPFNYQICTSIIAEVQARNSIGWGEPSRLTGPKVYREPFIMEQPTVEVTGSTDMKIQWQKLQGLETGCTPILGYQVIWTEDDSDQEKTFDVDATQSSLTIDVKQACHTEHIKIRAKNTYSHGLFSPEISIFTETTPDQMKPPTVRQSVESCELHVLWEIPKDCGAPIQRILPEVQTSEGNFHALHDCIDNEVKMQKECKVSMRILSEFPINLSQGFEIFIRAAAVNRFGKGKYSEQTASGTTVMGVPVQMRHPRMDQTQYTPNAMTIQWDELKAGQTGGAPITHYTLYWDKGTGISAYVELVKTPKFEYLLSNTMPSYLYNFVVHASNSCGQGLMSPNLKQRMPTVPQKPVLTSRAEQCGVVLAWDPPANGGLNVTEYKVEIQKRLADETSKFYSPNIDCKNVMSTFQCYIEMKDLQTAPYQLEVGQAVVARVAAQNMVGWGQFSDVSLNGPRVYREPGKVGQPVAELRKLTQLQIMNTDLTGVESIDSIKLSWPAIKHNETGGSPITAYEVHWDQNESNISDFKVLNETSLTTYTVKSVKTCSSYTFRVRAKNLCEFGPFSPPISVFSKAIPQQIEQIKAQVEGCKVIISWTAPFDCGSPIERYIVEVRAASGDFFVLPECGNGNLKRNCTIDMAILTGTNFNLKKGDSIVVKGTAINAIGAGDASDSVPSKADGSFVVSVPSQMSPPLYRAKSQTATGVTMFWPAIDDDRNGGTPITNYTLSWANETTTVPGNQATVNNLLPDKLYRFTVTATNECGIGQVSKSHMKRMPKRPDRPAIRISEEKCFVVVNWTVPFNGGVDLLDYKVEIQQKFDWKDVHQIEPEFSSKGLNCQTNGQSTGCRIHMETLQENPFNLDVGSEIVARISARNIIGFSEPSDVSINGPKIYYKPNVMHQPTVEALNQTSLLINWQKLHTNLQIGGSPILKYQLVMDDRTPAVVEQTLGTSYAIHNLEKCKLYSFRVRAQNQCGMQTLSPALKYVTNEVPKQMELLPMRGSEDGCSVTIVWKKPFECGTPLTKYQVEVRHRNKKDFLPLKNCGSDPKELRCTIPTKTLTDRKTFGLSQGELIIARAAAINSVGVGKTSQWIDGPMIIQGIVKVKVPLLIRSECDPSQASLALDWAGQAKVADGGQRVTSYKLFWDLGNSTGPVAYSLALDSKLQTSYKVGNLKKGTTYRFKLCAQTRCSMDIGECSGIVQYATMPEYPYQQFLLSNEAATWAGAQETCQKWGGNLASLKDERDRKQLLSVMDKNQSERYWIALNAILAEKNVWWIDRAECNYNQFFTPELLTNGTQLNTTCVVEEPTLVKYQVESSMSLRCDANITTSGFTQTCVELYRGGEQRKLQSNPLNCHEKRKFVCKKYAGPKVYRVSNDAMQLSNAEKFCAGWGGRLALAREEHERDEIRQLVDNDETYWVGSRFEAPVGRRLQHGGPAFFQSQCEQFRSGELLNTTQCDLPSQKFICEKMGNDPFYPAPAKQECTPVVMWNPAIKAGCWMFFLVCVQGLITLFWVVRDDWLKWRMKLRGIPEAPKSKRFPLDPFAVQERRGKKKAGAIGPIGRDAPDEPAEVAFPTENRYRESFMIKGDLVAFEPATLKVPLAFQVSMNFPKLEPNTRLEKEALVEDACPDQLKILIPLLKGPREPELFAIVLEPGHENECMMRTEPDTVADQPMLPELRQRMCRCHGVYDKRVDFADMTRKDRSASANLRNRSKSRQKSIHSGDDFASSSYAQPVSVEQQSLIKFLAKPHEIADKVKEPLKESQSLYAITESQRRPQTQLGTKRNHSSERPTRKESLSNSYRHSVSRGRDSGTATAEPKYRKFQIKRNRPDQQPDLDPLSGIHPVTGLDMQRFSLAVKVGTSTAPRINILNPTTVIGCNPALLFNIDDKTVSFEHVAIEIVSGVAYLKQLSDNKRTYLNGTRVDVRKDMLIKLKHGDIMQFGSNKTQFIFGDRDWSKWSTTQPNVYYSQSETDLRTQSMQKPRQVSGSRQVPRMDPSAGGKMDTVESVVSINKINLNMQQQLNQSNDQNFYTEQEIAQLSYRQEKAELNNSFDASNELNKSFNNSMRPKQNMSQSKFY